MEALNLDGNIAVVRRHVSRIKQLIANEEGLGEHLKPLTFAVHQLDQLTEELSTVTQSLSRGTLSENDKGHLFATLNATSLLEAEWDCFDQDLNMQTGSSPAAAALSVKSAWDKIKNAIKTAVKAISGQLWQIVSSLLTVKEWSVKGSISTGLLGLASAEVSVTFG